MNISDVSTATERLDGWGEIAKYLRRDVTTVIRWEKTKNLPVHRVPGGKRQAVFAYRHEIDTWLAAADSADNAPKDHTNRPGSQALGPLTQSQPTGAAAETGIRIPTSPKHWLSGKGRRVAVTAAVIGGFCLVVVALTKRPAQPTATNPERITRSHTHILSPLLNDGANVLYPLYDNGAYGVAVVPAKGGASTVVETGINNPELDDLAPGSGMMLLRDLVHTRDEVEPLYIEPPNGLAQRVGGILAYDAAWYPDGKRILFSADGIVYSTDFDGKVRQQLFSVPGNAFWFRWSPDGKKLRFTVIGKKNEETSIWEVGADGKEPRRLFPTMQYQQCCGSWTPNGNFFVFQARVENTFQIWAQRSHRSYFFPFHNRPFSLISGAINYRGPVCSQDGRKLFVRSEAPKGELVRYDSKAGEFIPVLPSISARTLAYSSDGKWIAYTSLADNQLWRCRADGTDCLQLTQGFKNTIMPRWAPNDRVIAFMGIAFTGEWGVFSVLANGGPVNSLVYDNQAKGYPDWSPDGKQLAFSDVPPVSQPKGIYVLDLRSHQITKLSKSAGYSFPRWSPDGRFLIAQHLGDLHLYLFDFASQRWRILADTPALYPTWSGDGRYVYFRSDTHKNGAIYRVKMSSRRIEKVASLAKVERGPFFVGDWAGLASDGSPLAVRNSTIEDIYAWDLVAK